MESTQMVVAGQEVVRASAPAAVSTRRVRSRKQARWRSMESDDRSYLRLFWPATKVPRVPAMPADFGDK